jgi:hypothetical protein
MLQFLPNYIRDVLGFTPAKNGLTSALPILCLWLSKTFSASLSSLIASRTKHRLSKTTLVKIFNAVASSGLAICIAIVPLFDGDSAFAAIAALCLAMAFAGREIHILDIIPIPVCRFAYARRADSIGAIGAAFLWRHHGYFVFCRRSIRHRQQTAHKGDRSDGRTSRMVNRILCIVNGCRIAACRFHPMGIR